METVSPDIEGHLVGLGVTPRDQALAVDEDDSVLANSIRRVLDAARRHPADSVAAFNNYM